MLSASYSRSPISGPSAPPATADPAALSSLPPFDASAPPSVVVSQFGTIHVLSYTPSEGDYGVPITVRIHFQPTTCDPRFVRLIIGQRAVATQVRELPNSFFGRWELTGTVPANETQSSPELLLSIQALNDNHEIIDTITFGRYKCRPSSLRPKSPQKCLFASRSPPKISSSFPEMSGAKRRSAFRQLPRSPIAPLPGYHRSRMHRRMKCQSPLHFQNFVNNDSTDNMCAQTPVLELASSVNNMCHNWTCDEIHAGRRLVRFSKAQVDCRLIVSCEPIRQDEYCENDSVISCIYHEEADTHVVTSVDVIFLLECLTGNIFPVEEKNRIRRNLEVLGPQTVSKTKPGTTKFFKRMMVMPTPMPRNIEKDIKVFLWHLLPQALAKILSKYMFYIDPMDSQESAPLTIVDPDSNSVLRNHGQVALPITIPTKSESVHDEVPFISPSSGSDTFSSSSDSPTTTSPTTSVYPLTSDFVENSGVIDFKPNGHHEYGLDSFNSFLQFDVAKGNAAVPDFSNGPTHYDYRFYENNSLDYTAVDNDPLGEQFHV